MHDHKPNQLQEMYPNEPVPEEVRRALFHRVQLETRRDVMEAFYLGDSLDPKRRKQLQALYNSKNGEFKQKAEASVSRGMREQWGEKPVFGQQTETQLRQVMLDRYLINSDSNAMEIAYLGRNLSSEQVQNAEQFYKKLTPEQQENFNQKAAAEYNLMWGAQTPTEQAGGRIRWLLRAEQLEQVYGNQVYRGDAKAKAQQKTQPKAQANPTQQTPQQSSLSPVASFKQKLAHNAQLRLQSNYNRLEADLKEYRNLSPNNPKWQQLRQLSQQDQQLVQLNNRLSRQISALTMKDHRETPFMSPNIMVDRTDMYPDGVVDPKIQAQIRELKTNQQSIQLIRRQMQALVVQKTRETFMEKEFS
jgi:hypothetical protein